MEKETPGKETKELSEETQVRVKYLLNIRRLKFPKVSFLAENGRSYLKSDFPSLKSPIE